ncbi:response regulator transcription factor [Metabacillus litoralis]|uniref:Response regulator transcription factor n=1 Tax=Metabacillus litoralis TaxID=152268 RepID=A0A5C6W1A3_9BACI|nr:response regulator transcription factor [Metabacillus litoralis]TXC90682.1 response regulator transcription factor [Metabacillus litoralis]
MYNVLIIDDEPMIREGLRTLIPWEDLGYQVIDTAKDGQEGLEKYRKNEIHLILADIRMPRMDGITLIETIRKDDDHVQFLVLSGYADFSYAQKAIRQNVTGYLLKPVEEEELIRYVKGIKKNLDLKQTFTEQQDKSLQEGRHAFFKEMIETCENAAVHNLNEDIIKLELQANNYQLVLMKFLDHTNLDLEEIRLLLTQEIEETWGYLFSRDQYLCIVLKDIRPNLVHYNELYDLVKSHIKNIKIVMSVSKVFTVISEIGEEFRKTKKILDNQFYYKDSKFLRTDSERFLIPNNLPNHEIQPHEFPIHSFTEKIYFALEAFNDQALKNVLMEAAQTMIDRNYSEEQIKTSFIRLLSMVLNKCLVNKQELSETVSDITADLYKINDKTSISVLLDYIYDLFLKVISSQNIGDQEGQLVKLVDFIHRNYHETLKLETLAKIFDYNSAYLGKIFKNHTGEYFNTYLDKVRMENAKKLLTEGMKVYQVADKVGYSNVDYFHNKFKKYVGMSPSKFRRKTP